MLNRKPAVERSARCRATEVFVTLDHLLAVYAEAISADREQVENDLVQCLRTAVALENVLVPHPEWASLVLNI
jgi:hypothetical protein